MLYTRIHTDVCIYQLIYTTRIHTIANHIQVSDYMEIPNVE